MFPCKPCWCCSSRRLDNKMYWVSYAPTTGFTHTLTTYSNCVIVLNSCHRWHHFRFYNHAPPLVKLTLAHRWHHFGFYNRAPPLVELTLSHRWHHFGFYNRAPPSVELTLAHRWHHFWVYNCILLLVDLTLATIGITLIFNLILVYRHRSS